MEGRLVGSVEQGAGSAEGRMMACKYADECNIEGECTSGCQWINREIEQLRADMNDAECPYGDSDLMGVPAGTLRAILALAPGLPSSLPEAYVDYLRRAYGDGLGQDLAHFSIKDVAAAFEAGRSSGIAPHQPQPEPREAAEDEELDNHEFAKTLSEFCVAAIHKQSAKMAVLNEILVAMYQARRRSFASHQVEPFVVKQYVSEERPCIKGNGFDGLSVGDDREEAQQFVSWVNAKLGVFK